MSLTRVSRNNQGLSLLSNRLHRNQGQVAMSPNLPQAPHRDVIEGALPLETGEASLYGLPLAVKGLPFGRVLPRPQLLHQLLVRWQHHDDGLRMVLPDNERSQRATGVSPRAGFFGLTPGRGRGRLAEPRGFNAGTVGVETKTTAGARPAVGTVTGSASCPGRRRRSSCPLPPRPGPRQSVGRAGRGARG